MHSGRCPGEGLETVWPRRGRPCFQVDLILMQPSLPPPPMDESGKPSFSIPSSNPPSIPWLWTPTGGQMEPGCGRRVSGADPALPVKRANSHCLLPSRFRGTHASASTPTWFCLAPNPIPTDPTLRLLHGGARC